MVTTIVNNNQCWLWSEVPTIFLRPSTQTSRCWFKRVWRFAKNTRLSSSRRRTNLFRSRRMSLDDWLDSKPIT